MPGPLDTSPARRRRNPAFDYCCPLDWHLRDLMRDRLQKMLGAEAPVVEEVNLRADVRADLIHAGELVHGYELKAGNDTLARLEKQAEVYAAVCDRCTIVTTHWHLDAIKQLLLPFWGILMALPSKKGEVLVEVRKARRHDHQSSAALLQLLWHEELVTALRGRGLPGRDLQGTKVRLAAVLTDVASQDEIRAIVRTSLAARVVAQRERAMQREAQIVTDFEHDYRMRARMGIRQLEVVVDVEDIASPPRP